MKSRSELSLDLAFAEIQLLTFFPVADAPFMLPSSFSTRMGIHRVASTLATFS